LAGTGGRDVDVMRRVDTTVETEVSQLKTAY
jgi:hypothetical protein